MYNHKRQSFKAGDVVFHEGDAGRDAYILLSGRVRVHRRDHQWDVTVAYFGRDEIFGEAALMSPGPRSATITVEEDCEVLVLEYSHFKNRIEDIDPVIRLFIDLAFERFRNVMLGKTNVTSDLGRTSQNAIVALSSIRLEAEIENAISANEFEMYYQPIICLLTGKLSGYEALMRWNKADGTLVPPDMFIPAAEKSGLIVKLTRIAIIQACSDLREISLSALKNPKGAKVPSLR